MLHVDRETGRVLIEGVGMVKRHTRPNPSKQIKGGIAERESPIAVSNVMMSDFRRRGHPGRLQNRRRGSLGPAGAHRAQGRRNSGQEGKKGLWRHG